MSDRKGRVEEKLKLSTLKTLSNEILIETLDGLARKDLALTADIIAHLAAMDERGLHFDLGYSSLYTYATDRLRFTEDAAYKRIRAARIVRKFPDVLACLESGELSLSTLVILAPALLGGGAGEELLDAAKGKSKSEVLELVSGRWPRGGPIKIELRVETAFVDKVEAAKALYAHQIPSGNLEELLDKALDVFIADGERKRFAQTERPRALGRKPTRRRGIPAAVKREVYLRDNGQCSFVGKEGRRCGERGFLEFDHKTPRARGGSHDADNIRLLCRAHNQRAAEHAFGAVTVRTARRLKRRSRQVSEALRNLDFDRSTIRAVVSQLDFPIDTPIEKVLREALKRAGATAAAR